MYWYPDYQIICSGRELAEAAKLQKQSENRYAQYAIIEGYLGPMSRFSAS
jgi:hypothetical protein